MACGQNVRGPSLKSRVGSIRVLGDVHSGGMWVLFCFSKKPIKPHLAPNKDQLKGCSELIWAYFRWRVYGWLQYLA